MLMCIELPPAATPKAFLKGYGIACLLTNCIDNCGLRLNHSYGDPHAVLLQEADRDAGAVLYRQGPSCHA